MTTLAEIEKNGRVNLTDEALIVEELRESYHKYGPLREVIVTRFGIAAGLTRKKAVPEWPEKFREVKDYYEHLKIMVADNIHEPKLKGWWTGVLSEAAKELHKQGVEKNKIAVRLEQDFPLSRRSIYRYLPDEFKEQSRADAGRKGGLAKAEKFATTVAAKQEAAPAVKSQPDVPKPLAKEAQEPKLIEPQPGQIDATIPSPQDGQASVAEHPQQTAQSVQNFIKSIERIAAQIHQARTLNLDARTLAAKIDVYDQLWLFSGFPTAHGSHCPLCKQVIPQEEGMSRRSRST